MPHRIIPANTLLRYFLIKNTRYSQSLVLPPLYVLIVTQPCEPFPVHRCWWTGRTIGELSLSAGPFCYTSVVCFHGWRLEQPASAHTPIAWFREKQACSRHFGSDIYCLSAGNEFGNWRATPVLLSTTLCSFSIIHASDDIQNVYAWLSHRRGMNFLKAGWMKCFYMNSSRQNVKGSVKGLE